MAAAGGFTSTQTTTHNVFDLTAITNRYLGQAGILASLSSGSAQAYVTGVLRATLSQCMVPIGQRLTEVPGQLGANPSYLMVGRGPATSVSMFRAALLSQDINDVDYFFAVRGVNDREAPTAATPLGSAITLANGNSAICHPDTAVAVGTFNPSLYHELEYLLALKLKTGGANPAGRVRVIAGVSYS